MMKIAKIVSGWKSRRGLSGKKPGPARPRPDSPASSLDWPKIGLIFLTIALLSVLMSVNLMPDRIALRLGQVSPRDVDASRSVIYVNSEKTALAQQAARLATRPAYSSDDSAVSNANRIVQEFYDRIERERAQVVHKPAVKSASMDQAVANLQIEFGSRLSKTQLHSLVAVSPAVFQKLRDTTAHLVSEAMAMDIRDKSDLTHPANDLSHVQQDIAGAARDSLAPEDAAIVAIVSRQALRPNRLLNPRRTEAAQENAALAVPPVYEPIARGDRIISAGEKVTQTHLDKFTALGLLNPHLAFETGAGVCVLAGVMVLLVVLFLGRTLPAIYTDNRRLVLLAIIVLVSVFGLKVGGTLLGLSFSSGQVGYLGMMSVVAAGMLVCVLLDFHLAVLIVALLAVQTGLIMNHEIRFTVMTLMSSLVGIVSVGSIRRKSNLPGITLALAGANLGLVWLLGLLLRDTLPELLTGSAWAIGSAAFATFLYWFGVLALEKPFGILTHTMLLEMSASDRPLLKQLCMVAPGTYAHSMMVGTLAEAGAQAVGADSLLCRVGGYYHDIGKMKRPEFFVENQRHGNVHGRLSPSLSALIITAHVRDGVELAQEHRLPAEIRDIIAQHHGTTLIRYFYHQALTDCASGEGRAAVQEERFRYPGPKPQTREATIVMLADSVEAAARCLDKADTERIEALIVNIVRDKIEDGQFDGCDLTFRDIKQITDAFLHVLTAMMHGRIDYPRTASGKPMEVSRQDLNPEPAPLSLSAIQAEREALNGESLPEADLNETQKAEETREIAAHLAKAETLGAVGTVGFSEGLVREEARPESAVSSSEETLTAFARPPRARSIMEPEVLYGRLPGERASSPDTNDGSD